MLQLNRAPFPLTRLRRVRGQRFLRELVQEINWLYRIFSILFLLQMRMSATLCLVCLISPAYL